MENCCKPKNSRFHECNNDCWQFCISHTHNINNALYLITYYYIVEGHVLLHGNIVVVAVVIKHETFSALGDNHIIIIIYIYTSWLHSYCAKLAHTTHTHYYSIALRRDLQPVQSLGNIRHIVLRDRNTVIN